ncbi:MAG TPA: serine/threonine-protein kinase [Pseudomonadota bacterium]|nr:serine/threonine-protein kinase [Pseudomonadota bacterium]
MGEKKPPKRPGVLPQPSDGESPKDLKDLQAADALARTVQSQGDLAPLAPDPLPGPPSAPPPVRDTLADAAPPSAMSGPPSSDPGQLRGAMQPHMGRYALLRKLGEGAMGVVYAAYDEELDRRVALKLIHPSLQDDSQTRARILREAQALARVSAPNVVTIYQTGEVDGQIFIAMEFVNGTTLSKWQSEEGRTWLDILRMYLDAGQGLLAAHLAGLIHRDFKPDNVLIGKDGRARVADFGLARMDSKAGANTLASGRMPTVGRPGHEQPINANMTQAGTLLGTPLYMSPEQHLGEATDARSDQFSFCVALYEALYNQLPFAGNTVEALAFNTISGRIQNRPSGSRVPMVVHQAILRGLATNPTARFPSMRELLVALSYDPTVDRTAGPRVRRRVTSNMIAFMLIAAAGPTLLHRAGLSEYNAALSIAAAYFAVFVFMAIRFRRAIKNAFHRGFLVYGTVFGAQVLAIQLVGYYLGLSLSQIATLDLVALSAMTCVAAALVLPRMWTMALLGGLATMVALWKPVYAQHLSSAVVVVTTIVSLLLWNAAAAAAVRAPRNTPALARKKDGDR